MDESSRVRSRQWALGAAACLVLTGIAYAWLDRPIALYVNANFHGDRVLDAMQKLPEVLPGLAALVLAALLVAVAMGWRVGPVGEVLVRCSLSLVVAVALKEQLKYLFGRTWPETWINDNPSFIKDGAFGFNPLHGGPGYASFPSGHMTAITSVLAVLWIAWPGYRWLYAILWADVVVGLLGSDYHWLSDIVAGTFLGAAVGTVAATLGSGMRRAS